ncbi:hypothetical protein ACHQM5_000673 [Ranunculus cassubicifolius]
MGNCVARSARAVVNDPQIMEPVRDAGSVILKNDLEEFVAPAEAVSVAIKEGASEISSSLVSSLHTPLYLIAGSALLISVTGSLLIVKKLFSSPPPPPRPRVGEFEYIPV